MLGHVLFSINVVEGSYSQLRLSLKFHLCATWITSLYLILALSDNLKIV